MTACGRRIACMCECVGSNKIIRRPEMRVVTWSDERQQCLIERLAMKRKKRFREKIRETDLEF